MAKKLIRSKILDKLKPGEWEIISDKDELNFLYGKKVLEELYEIQSSGHKDIMEFVDLIHVTYAFANQNGFTNEEISKALLQKDSDKGYFDKIVLNNLNPNNPSNDIYFESGNHTKEEMCQMYVQGRQDNYLDYFPEKHAKETYHLMFGDEREIPQPPLPPPDRNLTEGKEPPKPNLK
jgi:predicted house-cleaning noncanonical NTP pyrophosphatase (MazG superfamily)